MKPIFQSNFTRYCVGENLFVFLCMIGLFAISALCYQYQSQPGHGFDYDATGYLQLAKTYAANGILASSGSEHIRTYFYPLCLSFVLQAASFLKILDGLSIVISQTLLYFSCVFLLYKTLSKTNKTQAKFIFSILCLNIFYIPYLSVPLTDALYVDFFILWFASFMTFFNAWQNNGSTRKLLLSAISLSLLASIILMIRPAGMWVVVVTVLVLFFYGVKNLVKTRRISFYNLFFMASCIAVFIIPLIPQITINMFYFDHFTPLPHFDLTAIHLGSPTKQMIKYGTFLGESYRGGLAYGNPFYVSGMEDVVTYFGWYFAYPLQGIMTLLLKFVGIFDYDYISPYIYSLDPTYTPYTRIVSLSIFVLGMLGLLAYTIGAHQARLLGPKYFPALCFVCWAGFTLFFVPELRFGLPMLTLFIMLAVNVINNNMHRKKALVLGLLAYLTMVTCLFFVGAYITAQLLNKSPVPT